MSTEPVFARFNHIEDAVKSCEEEGKDVGRRVVFGDYREKVHRYDWVQEDHWNLESERAHYSLIKPLFVVGDEKMDRIRKILSVMGHQKVTICEHDLWDDDDLQVPAYLIDGIHVIGHKDGNWEVGYDEHTPATRWEPEDADYISVGVCPTMEMAVIEAGMMLHNHALNTFFENEAQAELFNGEDYS